MKKMRFIGIAAILITLVSLSSCDDVFYDDGLSGHWECVSFRGYAIAPEDFHTYTNFSNRTGYFEEYDDYGHWTRYYYKWWTTNRRTVVFDWTDAYGSDPAEYYYDFDRGFLYLTDVYNTDRYWSYALR